MRTVRDERHSSPTAVEGLLPANTIRSDGLTAGAAATHWPSASAVRRGPGVPSQALKWRAAWGVWAGVWIDGCHDDALPYLNAIAADDAAPNEVPPATTGITASAAPPAPAPLRRPSVARPSRATPAAAVLARSSGHCEVFTESCRYTLDRVVSRRRGGAPTENASPAELFGACGACAEVLARLQPQLAARSGYLVDPGRDPAVVPFHWRGSRWVLLDRDGWLTEIREDAQTA